MGMSFRQGVAVAAIAAATSTGAIADGERRIFCSDTLVEGTYGIQMQGTRPATPGGPTESVIGIVVRHYDGKGGVTQIDNIKGSISGIVPDRFGAGTYRVNDDCTVVIDFQPAPGLLIQERAVILDGGSEMRTITVMPAAVMVTSVQKKI